MKQTIKIIFRIIAQLLAALCYTIPCFYIMLYALINSTLWVYRLLEGRPIEGYLEISEYTVFIYFGMFLFSFLACLFLTLSHRKTMTTKKAVIIWMLPGMMFFTLIIPGSFYSGMPSIVARILLWACFGVVFFVWFHSFRLFGKARQEERKK